MFFLKHKITNFRELLLYYRKKFKQLRNTKTIKTMGKTVKKEIGFSLWKRKFLPHIIVERPLGIGEECKENGFIRADDQFFIMNDSIALGNFHLYIGLVLFLVALFLFGEGTNTEITLSASSFLIGSFYIIYNFTHPKKNTNIRSA